MYIPADLVPERQHTSSPFRIEELFEDLRFRTEEHVHCLEAVGMGERAQGIRIERFSRTHPSDVDLAPFQTKSPIPVDVMDFDPSERNTLLTSCRSAQGNRPDDIQRVLDIRLYPVLRELIEKWGLEVFLGSEREFEAYYQSERWEPIIKFHIPSAAKYYLVRDSRDNLKVVLSGLVGRENLIAQLMTVKLAGLLRDDISIIGDPGHLHDLARDQVLLALDTIPGLRHGPNALIVAGCGLEENANAVARKVLGDAAAPSQVFHQTIVSLTYTPV
ncbi:MAG: hypothetical protein KDK78_11515, partial [Chlamydiia bacterium]|nr:hypothetical protein [Chlamydiia bacterium]